jgi:hypothetical protein
MKRTACRSMIPAPILLAAILFFSSSCTGVKVQVPEGFAELKLRRTYRAVSPEGVLYSVRTVRNYPRQGLAFWEETLRGHLLDEGYQLIGEGERFPTEQGEGMLYEWGLPYGQNDYLYLTAVIPAGRRIVVAEAAGEQTLYRRHRDALLKSLKTIEGRF